MFKLTELKDKQPHLQEHQWPPLPRFKSTPDDIREFLSLPRSLQKSSLAEVRDTSAYDEFINTKLAYISGYLFSYCDGPLHLAVDEDLEYEIQRMKLSVESEVLNHWLSSANREYPFKDSAECADYLQHLTFDNPGINHPLFDFLRNDANEVTFKYFLRNEVCRNEVVDDEVAVMTTGIQGAMKAAVCSNLWDEVGQGNLGKFHTYWLRELVEDYSDWHSLIRYRAEERPWFTMITTNVFNILLTRPGLKFRRYGWFLLNEGWVSPHFTKVLFGMDRVGLCQKGQQIYFKAHESIDPRHTEELIESIRYQRPALSDKQMSEIACGAHMSLEASLKQYDAMLNYLVAINDGKIVHKN
ncbi:MAG: iron-containing redox enzyme family protein [Reinekea sp.]|nr:iron-containing redox enzyme family protein [Reinekea sp.]